VIQGTVNPPPLARLVRSQDAPPFFKESNMKKKTTPQPRNYLVKLALFRKAGSHKKSNKAIRRLEKSKKSGYSKVYFGIFCYNHLTL
jgi:hypothetical protein